MLGEEENLCLHLCRLVNYVVGWGEVNASAGIMLSPPVSAANDASPLLLSMQLRCTKNRTSNNDAVLAV